MNTPSSGSSRPLTPRFVFNYQPDADSLYYASAAKGFRPGRHQHDAPGRLFYRHRSLAGSSGGAIFLGFIVAIRDRHQEYAARPSPDRERRDLLHQVEEHPAVHLPGLRPRHRLQLGRSHGQRRRSRGPVAARSTLSRSVSPPRIPTPPSTTMSYSGPATGSSRAETTCKPRPGTSTSTGSTCGPRPDVKPYLRLDYQYATPQRSLIPYTDPANGANADPTLPGLPEIRILNLRAGVRFNGVRRFAVREQRAQLPHADLRVARLQCAGLRLAESGHQLLRTRLCPADRRSHGHLPVLMGFPSCRSARGELLGMGAPVSSRPSPATPRACPATPERARRCR